MPKLNIAPWDREEIEAHEELGPNNPEARELVNAINKTINEDGLYYYCDCCRDNLDCDETNSVGVGKDLFGKYCFATIDINGKKYFVQIRDSEKFAKVSKQKNLTALRSQEDSLN